MPPWARRMPRADIERATELAKSHTLDEIVAMAIARHKKDTQIGLWVLVSCLLGVFSGMYLIVSAGNLGSHPLAWTIGFFASLFLPLPAMLHGRAGHREGKVIALAHYFRKDPRFPAERK